jgi:hypothetical protein
VALVLVGSYSMQILKVNANGFNIEFSSVEENGVTSNLGTITAFGETSAMVLPKTRGPNAGSYTIIYNPAESYNFVKWETTGGVTVTNPNIQSTTMNVEGDGTVTAVYIVSAPVGGVATPTNKLEILAPYLALAGLIAAVSAVYVIKRRKD